MSSNNGHSISITQKRGEAIEQLLNGRSETIKANVLSYIIKYQIDPQDEFFIIFVALGTLETLIETSPKEWQQLFEGFGGKLDKWADTNLETLTAISQKATTTERLGSTAEELANSSKSLGNCLTKFLEVCGEQMSQLQESNALLTNYLSQSPKSKTNSKDSGSLKTGLSQLESKIDNLNSLVKELEKSNRPNLSKIWVWKDSLLCGLVTIVLLTTVSFGVNQNRVSQSTSQKVQWLLQKANRMDCRMGIKKPGSPECKGL